jgi:hypothetical protein
MMRRLLHAFLLVIVGASLVLVPAALALQLTYAGPKTWLQGWEEAGSYEGGPFYWRINWMGPKSDDACYPNCSSRVTFIDIPGNWHYSYTDTNSWTVRGIPEGEQFFYKKPLCKNNSSSVYTAQCDVSD